MIKKINIIGCSLFLVMLIQINFLNLYYVDWKAQIQGIIIFCVFILCGKNFFHNADLYNYAVVVFASVILEIIVSVIRYDQGIIDTIKKPLSYLSVLGALLFYEFYIRKGDRAFWDKVIWIVLVAEILLLVQALLYNNGISIIFLRHFFSGATASSIRNGLFRSGMIPRYFMFASFYSFYIYLTEKRKLHYLLCTILGICCEFYVAQVRASMYLYVLGLYLMYVILNYIYGKKQKVIVILAIAVLLVFVGNIFETIIASFVNAEADTISGRTVAVAFYWEQLLQNPLTGAGFIYPSNSNNIYLMYGPDIWHKFNTSDLGLFGFVYQFGLLVIPVFIAPYVNMIQTARLCFRARREISALLIVILIYIIGSSVTLCVYMHELIFFLAFFEYQKTLYYEEKEIG